MVDDDGLEVVPLAEIVCQLRAFEQQYRVSSEVFYNLWLSGQAPVQGTDKLRWTAYYEATLDSQEGVNDQY